MDLAFVFVSIECKQCYCIFEITLFYCIRAVGLVSVKLQDGIKTEDVMLLKFTTYNFTISNFGLV